MTLLLTTRPKAAGGLGSGEGSVRYASRTSKEMVNKRGRGRPRKYDNGVPISNGSVEALPPPTAAYCSTKRPWGRPKGTGKFQALASTGEYMDTARRSFTPHVLPMYKGEDLVDKIVSFCARACHSVCVLTASGAVSSVTLCAPDSSAGTFTYEERFEILTLTGSSVVSGEVGTITKPLILASFKQNIGREIRRKYCGGASTSANIISSS
ncbi:AT-hook motif nuclear-localized protein 9-like [Hibiscus syriacus]|uniref:AT-hook motif nuclear-localized protein 9-like n=1 Tax=Hibiscus syriacus TaxID=106335 RepID=UPI001921BF20|nr:AT-hook motif nuclear-localized protein 9-like [Hibiscus syriacus]